MLFLIGAHLSQAKNYSSEQLVKTKSLKDHIALDTEIEKELLKIRSELFK